MDIIYLIQFVFKAVEEDFMEEQKMEYYNVFNVHLDVQLVILLDVKLVKLENIFLKIIV